MTIPQVLKKLTNKTAVVHWHHLLFFGLIILLTPQSGFWFDLNDWSRWSVYTFEHGLSKIYASDTNYMPLYLHILYFFGQFQGSVEAIQANIYQIKYVFLVFDFAAPIAIAYTYRAYFKHSYAAYILLFNVAYLYETVLWGQLDSVPTTIVILAFLSLLNGRHLWGVFFCTLSVYAKLQAIVFLPFFVLLFVVKFGRDWTIKKTLQSIVIFVLTQVVLLFPFILGGTIDNFFKVVAESVGFFPRVTWNAYNIWHLLLKTDPNSINDTLPFWGLTYKKWGFVGFFLFSGAALLPVAWQTWLHFKNNLKLSKNYLEIFWLTAGLISVIFFFFNTQMHERYAFPALVMFFVYGLLSRKYLLYALSSFAHLVNIDAVYHALKIPYVKPEIIALLYVIILVYSFYQLFKYRKFAT